MPGYDKVLGYVEAEAVKLIRRQRRYETSQKDEAARIQRRSGVALPVRLLRPEYWATHPGFDPFHVKRNAKGVAHSIHRSLLAGAYAPRPAVIYKVPKASGEMRDVSVFQIADNAVSRLVYKALITKNAPRFSPRCYSYRTDITLHDAVSYVASELRNRSRVYLAEFDFRKFFDSISHEHIERILVDRRFFVTELESKIIRAFLKTPSLPSGNYLLAGAPARERGIPQGTSISLFLANAAALPLDMKLERLGVQFVRYADDTLIWSNTYGEVCRAVEALCETAYEMGVEVNFDKSEGISILADPGEQVELRDKNRVEFIGYSISKHDIGIRESSVARIKRRLAYIIYSNLLEEPLAGNIIPSRFAPRVDRDYVVMLLQIRRYLYGDINEQRLRQYLARTSPRIHYKGLMSFYPIVDDEEVLQQLDGWLLHTVHTSLRKRAALLRAAGHAALPSPHGRAKADLLKVRARTTSGQWLDLSLPSFVRIGKLVRRAAQQHGANAVANTKSTSYYDDL